MLFWNEHLPNLLRHPNKDNLSPLLPKRPRPSILDRADGIGRYANASNNRNHETYDTRLVTNSKNAGFWIVSAETGFSLGLGISSAS